MLWKITNFECFENFKNLLTSIFLLLKIASGLKIYWFQVATGETNFGNTQTVDLRIYEQNYNQIKENFTKLLVFEWSFNKGYSKSTSLDVKKVIRLNYGPFALRCIVCYQLFQGRFT